MKKDLTLLILAAGMGSRYGSLKQMDGVGPHNEAILDYSIFDAIRAGFTRAVFVIRHSFEQDFREVFTPERFGGKIKIDFVFQELDSLPEGYSVPEGRVKPWGTNHAIMMAAEVIDTPFAVINADDFYGAQAYQTIADYLNTLHHSKDKYCMVGYRLENTLSENGSVSRGVCNVDSSDNLQGMTERTKIFKEGQQIVYQEGEQTFPLENNTPVSMNLFGFTPDYFDYSNKIFKDFLENNAKNITAEFYIPFAVNTLIEQGTATMRVLDTTARWFGVTYKEDRPDTVARIKELTEQGIYPEPLWK
ncbi:MAG: sugar phosphate nucleotidyltransferase [Rikenellaceae bacterium]